MKLKSCGSTIAALIVVANLALAFAAENKDVSDKVDETEADAKRASWQEVKRDEQTAESAAATQTSENNDSSKEDVDKKASWMDVKKKASWMDVKKKASWMDVKKKASWMDVKKRASWMDVKRASWMDVKRDNAQNQDEQIQRLIELLQNSATA